MGSRMTQFVGFNDWTTKFLFGQKELAYTERVTRVYPDGREAAQPDRPVMENVVKCEPSGEHFNGMFSPAEEYDLHNYTFPDGKVFYSKVQAMPWSSGPVIFLALKDETGAWVPESLWGEEEIEERT